MRCAESDNPTWARILSITARWVMTAMASMVIWQLVLSSTFTVAAILTVIA
ncbi:MAG: hypothetical protein HY898_21265 [Deltaproteobacteria bacterium]|nr:hypothetical protein [Deltaproteobacteria bacterium]